MFGVFYMTPEVVSIITENLQGEDFCTDPDMDFPEEEVAGCAENMGIFMPPALALIGESVIQYDNAICNGWYDGVCPAKIF